MSQDIKRVTAAHAAEKLDISPTTLWRLQKRGLFTVVHPNGSGPGKRCFYLVDELDEYSIHGESGLAKFRAKKKRITR